MGADPASLAIKAGAMALQMGLAMTNKIEGPRLDSLDVTTADYGTPITYFWGTRRLEGCPIIWAEKLREKKTTSKTKGGKYAEYKYYGTFAILVAGHHIDVISRIWLDKHLVYDVTKKGPISPLIGMFQALGGGAPVKLARGKNVRFYDGTQTEPDHRMEAWCEDRYGPDSCPAYKDLAYAVFQELPLEKFGNRIPQVTVEAVNLKEDQYLTDTIPGIGLPLYSPDYMRFFHDGALWDTATLTKIVDLSFTPAGFGTNGTIWQLEDGLGTGGGPFLTQWSGDGQFASTPVVAPDFTNSLAILPSDVGPDQVFLLPYDAINSDIQELNGAEIVSYDINFSPTIVIRDADGQEYAVGREFSGSNGIHIASLSFLREGGGHSTIASSSNSVVVGWLNAYGEWVFKQDDVYRRVDPETLNVLQTETIALAGDVSAVPGGESVWVISGSAATEISLLDLSVIRTVALSLWGWPGGSGGVYDPINHGFALYRPDSDAMMAYLDRVGAQGINLGDIIEDVADWCGAEVDVSDLDQTVRGYSVSQGAGKDMLAPLLDIHDVDARPHDFGLQFIKRGRAVEGEIATAELVREGDEPRYQISIQQDTDLPRRLTLNFADFDKDQQTNTVISQRPLDGADSVRAQQIDLTTYVATPGEAQKFTDRYFRRQWNERETIALGLTAQRMAAEPGDTFNLTLDGIQRYARLKKTTFSQGRIQTEWVRDALSFNTLSSGVGAEMDGRDDDEIYISGAAKGFVLDTPLHEDLENSPNVLLHYGIGVYGDTSFPGGTMFQLDPVEHEYGAWATVSSSEKGVWGYASDALPDASPSVWDARSTVTVGVKGTLTSRTQDEIDADPTINLAYLGRDDGDGELLNFATATLNGDGTYTLSNFKRGRRGTEWAIGGHAVGDLFVLCSTLKDEELGVDEIGETITFKGQSDGRSIEGQPEIELPIVARSLKPYAPTALAATRDVVSEDWTLSWTRRTRIGGNWGHLSSIPLGETTEAYRVRLFDEDGEEVAQYDTTDPEFTYDAADQVSDFGSEQTAIHWSVCQLGDAVEGFQSELRVGFPPTVRSIGERVKGSGASITVGLPDGIEADDVLLLAVNSETPSGPTLAPDGWEEIEASPQTGAVNRLSLFACRAGFGAEPPVVLKPSGAAGIGAQIVAVSGAIPIGAYVDESAGGIDTGFTYTSPGLTTNVNAALVLDFFAVRANTPVNASLTALTQVFETGTGSLNVGCCAGVKVIAGAVSATTMNHPSGGTNEVGCIKVAIKPR